MSDPSPYRDLTTAHIRDATSDGSLEVVFLESARFYRLRRGHADFNTLQARLRIAVAQGDLLRIRFASPGSDVIEDVQAVR